MPSPRLVGAASSTWTRCAGPARVSNGGLHWRCSTALLLSSRAELARVVDHRLGQGSPLCYSVTHMSESVGVRELRQNLSRYLERVKAGGGVVVTERGRGVARLIPAGGGGGRPARPGGRVWGAGP